MSFAIKGVRVWMGRSRGFYHILPGFWVMHVLKSTTVNLQWGPFYIEFMKNLNRR